MEKNTDEIFYILYDGNCNLCNNGITFLRKHGKNVSTEYITLQSDQAKELLARFTINDEIMTTMYVIKGEKCLKYSDAILTLLIAFGYPYRFLSILYIIPRGIRDAVYKWISRHRYIWFGENIQCNIKEKKEK